MSKKVPSDYSFFLLLDKNLSAEETYSFADNNTDEDINSIVYLDRKHIDRI